MNIENAVVMITGAGGGIGSALASTLRSLGATVVTTDLAGRGADVTLDVVDRAAVRAAIEGVLRDRGRLDVVVANAGVAVGGLVDDMAPDDWDRTIDVNIRGTANTVDEAYRAMRPAGRGSIVLVASLAGLAGTPGLTAYSMSKHAVVGLGTSLRPEAALHGIGVTVVCPGPVETPLLDVASLTPGMDVRRYLKAAAGPTISAERLAGAVCRAIERDRPFVVPGVPAVLWRLHRHAPNLVAAVMRRNFRSELRHATAPAGAARAHVSGGTGPHQS